MARPRGPSRRPVPTSGTPDFASRVAPWAGLAILLVATGLAYAPSLRGSFVLDDWGSIQANMRLRQPDAVRVPSLPELLGPSRPVTELTFAADYRAAGLDPVRFHAVGLALHLAATLLAFVFLESLLRRAGHARPRGVALVVAGIFALHPIQAEAVAYAAQRSEVLASLLYLAALALLDRSAAGWGTGRGIAAWAGGALAWLVGMGAKTIAISLPGAFVVDQAVVAPASERGTRALWRRVTRALLLVAPLLALGAWSASLHFRTFAAEPGGGAGFAATSLSASTYFLTQLRVQWLYLRLLAWPSGLAFDRSFEPSLGPDGAVLVAAAGALAVVAVAGWLGIRAERSPRAQPAGRLAAFGILFWFVVLSPTSSFVPVNDLAVEHRVYLASLGPFLAVTIGADALLHHLLPGRRASVASATIASVLLLALGLALGFRARVWSSDEALWREAATASPDNPRAWTNLAITLRNRGDLAGSESAYRRAWTVARHPGRVAALARNHASLLIDTGRPVDALEVLDRGLAVSPDDPSLRLNRAAALGKLGRLAEALAEARRAAAVSPGDPLMRNVLGQALAVNGEWAAALAEFRAAEALDPGVPSYSISAAIALAGLGRREEACAAFRDVATRYRARPLPLDAAARAAALGCPLPTP
jgi:Flp pilus assembly protein TadD